MKTAKCSVPAYVYTAKANNGWYAYLWVSGKGKTAQTTLYGTRQEADGAGERLAQAHGYQVVGHRS